MGVPGDLHSARLRLHLLGGLVAEGVDLSGLGSLKARLLVKRLALARGAAVPREALIEALWGSTPPADPAAQLSVLVSRARRVLGADRLLLADAGYRLLADWWDVDALHRLVDEAAARLGDGEPGSARAAAAAALELVHGPVLPDEPDADWVRVERDAAALEESRARRIAAEAALGLGVPDEAVVHTRRVLEANPYDEAAVVLQMRALAAGGRTADALATYSRLAGLLREDLGIDPAPETQEAHLALLRRTPSPAPHRPPASDGDLPGRERELRTLDAELDAARRDGPRTVLVEGEAGIGKTRLLDTWLRLVEGGGAPGDAVLVVRTRCTPASSRLPLECLLSALSRHLRALDAAALAAVLDRGNAVLEPLLGLGRPVQADDRALLSPTTPDAGLALVLTALSDLLGRLSETGPVVLAIDDAEHLDPTSADWLALAPARLDGRPVLFVVSGRSPGGPVPGDATIRLGPLDLVATRRLVGPERAEDLHARSGGHPLFLTELARTSGTRLPESIREAVHDRCEAAGEAGTTLRLAAVLGSRVDLDLLATVLRAEPWALLDHLEAGVAHAFLAEEDPGFAFRHELVREALVSGVSAARRTLLHRAAAQALWSRPGHDPVAVARHARLCQDGRLEALALAEAAEIAAQRHSHAEAVRLLDEAVALDATAAVRVRRARALLALGRHEEAASDVEPLLSSAGGEDLVAAHEVAAMAAYLRRRFDSACSLADSGAALGSGSEAGLRCAEIAARAQHAAGELADAHRRCAALLATSPGAPRPATSIWMAALRLHRGDVEAALELLASASPAADEWPWYVLPQYHQWHAHASAMAGRPLEALRALDRLDDVVEEQQALRFRGRSANYRGWILRCLGDQDGAEEWNLRALAEATGQGSAEPAGHALLDLAEGRIRSGDLAGAAEHLERAVATITSVVALQWRLELRTHLLSGRLALADGRPEAALEEAETVLASAAALELPRYLVQGRLLRAEARHASGGPVDVDSMASWVADLDRTAPLESWWLTGQLARRFGHAGWSRLAARRADRLAEVSGPHAARVRSAAARALDGLPG